MSKKYDLIFQAAILAALGALLGVGSVYDAAAAEKLFTGEGFITVCTEILGKMPLFLAVSMACCVAFFTAADNKKLRAPKAWNVFLKMVYAVGGIFSASFMFKDLFDLLTESTLMSLAMCGMAGVALFTFLTIVTPRVGAKKLRALKKWALVTILAALIIVCLTEAVKLLWGRARPYEVAEGATFTPWYMLSSAGGESFFSGHAACCMGMLMFVPLLRINNAEPVYRLVFAVLAALFIVCTMLGRMMSGAHYLTDVAAGAIISEAVLFAASALAFRKGYEAKPGGFCEKYL